MYNKIAIVGAPGTGKTTLSNMLSKIYGIEATHIDGIHHLENWEVRDKGERDNIILDIVKKDKWIIDGTYRNTLRQRFESADLIIWLDYSTIAQIKGVMQRFLKNKGKEKPEIPGCKEKMDKEFFTYVLKYNREKRKYIENNLEGIDKSKLMIFKNRKSLNKWVEKERKING